MRVTLVLGQLDGRPHADPVLARRHRDHLPLRLPLRARLPGTVSNFSQSTAGSVGFGVLGNGFGAGIRVRDAEPGRVPDLRRRDTTPTTYPQHAAPQSRRAGRGRSSRATFTRPSARRGLVKLFANGAWQRLYDFSGSAISADVYGAGYGGRLRGRARSHRPRGPLGQGHRRDVFARAAQSLYFVERTAGRSSSDTDDPRVGMGDCRRLPAGQDANRRRRLRPDPARRAQEARSARRRRRHARPPAPRGPGRTGVATRDGRASTSADYVTIRQQLGIGAGLTVHAAENFHFTFEYFHAIFQWCKPTPGDRLDARANPSAGAELRQRRRHLRLLAPAIYVRAT